MRTYRAGSRWSLLVNSGLGLLVGGVFVTVGIAKLLQTALDRPDALLKGTTVLMLGIAVAGAAALALGFKSLWRMAYEVSTHEDGRLEFLCLLRTRTFRAWEIQVIERTVAKIKEEDVDPREVVFHASNDSARVPYFDDIDQLIAEIQRWNPSLRIEGQWH